MEADQLDGEPQVRQEERAEVKEAARLWEERRRTCGVWHTRDWSAEVAGMADTLVWAEEGGVAAAVERANLNIRQGGKLIVVSDGGHVRRVHQMNDPEQGDIHGCGWVVGLGRHAHVGGGGESRRGPPAM